MVALRRALPAIAVVLVLLATQLVSAGRAAAAACGATQNLQIGYATNNYSGSQPSAYEGAGGNLLDAGGYVLCSTDTNGGVNFSTSWVMLFGSSGGYEQTGTMYRYGYGSCVKRWDEEAVSGGFTDYYIGGCSTAGETHHYVAQSIQVSGSYRIRGFIDSTVIHTSTFNPFTSWTSPYQVAFSSETYHAETHVPGTASNPQDWSSMQVQKYDNNFYGACGNVLLGQYNQNSANWADSAPACDHVRSWTK